MKLIFRAQFLFGFLSIMTLLISCNTDDDPKEDVEQIDEGADPDQEEDADSSVNLVAHVYPKTEGPDKNPLKGWNTGWWNNDAHASVGFQYLKWSEFEPTNGSYDYNYIEEVINRPGTKGRHLILRLYADWYGEDAVSDAGPSWLYDEIGVARLQNNGKYITDYNNPKFIEQAQQAIAALAEKYDNDPRIYAFHLGLIGYWGEWHTSSFADYEISDATKETILNSYINSFDKVRIMGRYPWREPLSDSDNIGFHNDYFGPVGHSYDFDEAVNEDRKWENGPVGGEYPPGVSDAEYAEMYNSSKGMEIIETGHYSTMQAKNPCESTPSNCQGFMRLHRKMGYNYQIDKAVFADSLSRTDKLETSITLQNIGVAPIYYSWTPQLALLKDHRVVAFLEEVDYDLQQAAPATSFTLKTKIEQLNDIAIGTYQLGLRIIQPTADSTKDTPWSLDARNTYMLFSNEMETIIGEWNTSNHSLQGGWSILGAIEIEE